MGWSPVEISMATQSLERAALIATVCATRHEMSRDAGAQDWQNEMVEQVNDK